MRKDREGFYFNVGKKDSNAMEIDAMSMEKRAAVMRKGACFICEEPGHLAQDHKKQMEKGNNLPQKMKGRELHALIRALLARMTKKSSLPMPKNRVFD